MGDLGDLDAWTVIGTVLVVLAVVGVGWLLDRRFHILPRAEDLRGAQAPERKPPVFGPGEAPAVAIAATGAQLDKLRVRRCALDRAELESLPDDTVRYEGRALVVLRFRCPRCGKATSLYLAPKVAA